MMRNYGQRSKYEHIYPAWNKRMDALQAAILRVKLRHLDKWNDARRRHASIYDKLLNGSGLVLPRRAPDQEHVFHLYVVQSEARDELLAHLASHQIQGGIHYPIPIHLQAVYGGRGIGRGSLPISEALTPRVLSLPMYPELSEEQIERVADAITSFVRQVHTTRA